MALGERLAEYRKRFNYTQKQLAEKIQTSQQVISNIERNETAPDIEFLKKSADLYDITIDELIGRQVTAKTTDSYEQMILEVVGTLDEGGKKLSYDLISQVAQHRSKKE